MKDIIFSLLMLLLCVFHFNKLAKVKAEQHDKALKNDIEKTK